MEDGAEFTGKTVADAIAQAEAQLGNRDLLEVEVISQGRSGVFGIGAEAARIRARRQLSTDASRAETITPTAPETDGSDRLEIDAFVSTPATDGPEPSEDGQNGSAGRPLDDDAVAVLSELLRTMGFDAKVTVQNSESPLTLAIQGENLGVLIGRRGDNLAALQFMVNLILSKNRRQWPKVVLDVENYRARREESLRALADRIAFRVSRNGRPFTLEAMPASDRRVIHLALRDRKGIETYSVGEGPARRVVVAPNGGSGSQE